MITHGGRSKREDDTDLLSDYVAKDGQYTPFVKSVTLYYPRELLKHITIVDTPGLNDPNRYRSQLTKDWMNKASANIYVLYANQAMQQSDVDFIDNFLIHVPLSHQILAVNKIDTVDDPEQVKSWLNRLLSEGLGSRKLGSADSVVYVSGLGALIDSLSEKLPENLQADAKRLDEKDFLEPAKHGLESLRALIEQRLIEDKGSAILAEHDEFLSSIFTQKTRYIDRQLAQKTESLKHCHASLEELRAQRERLQGQEQEVGQVLNDFKLTLQQRRAECGTRFQQRLDSVSTDVLEAVRSRITALAKIKEYRSEVPWYVKNAIDECRERIENEGHSVANELEQELHAALVRCKDSLKDYKMIYIGVISEVIDVEFDDSARQIQSEADTAFSEMRINELTKQNTFFIQRWFDTRGGRTNTREALLKELDKFLKKNLLDGFVQYFMNEIQRNNNKLLERLQIEVKEIMASLRDDLDEIIEQYDQRELRERGVESEIQALHGRREWIAELQRKVLQT